MATLDTNIKQVNADFQAIKNKIVEKGVEVADGTRTAEYAEKIDAVYDKGKRAEHDAFWDAYQENGNRRSYICAFGGSGWTNETFKPKHDIHVTDGYMMFRNAKITGHLGDILSARGLSFNTSGIYSSNYMFSSCNFTGLPTMNMSNAEIGANMFGSSMIETIDKIIVNKNTSYHNDAFGNTGGLMYLVIEGEIAKSVNFSKSVKLIRASIESIITHLSDTASDKTLTLSKTAVETAFNTDEWHDIMLTKSNWTITLV